MRRTYDDEKPYSFPEDENKAENEDEALEDEENAPEVRGIRGFFNDFLGTKFGVDREAPPPPEKPPVMQEVPPVPQVSPAVPPVDSTINTTWNKPVKNPQPKPQPKGVRDMTALNSDIPNVQLHSLNRADVDEINEVVNMMRANIVVMLNLEYCSGGDCDKIITFLSGAACFQQGVVKRHGKRIYVFAPPNMDIGTNIEEDFDFSSGNYD